MWSLITGWAVADRVFALFPSPISFLPIPKRAMTQDQQGELRTLLTAKGLNEKIVSGSRQRDNEVDQVLVVGDKSPLALIDLTPTARPQWKSCETVSAFVTKSGSTRSAFTEITLS